MLRFLIITLCLFGCVLFPKKVLSQNSNLFHKKVDSISETGIWSYSQKKAGVWIGISPQMDLISSWYPEDIHYCVEARFRFVDDGAMLFAKYFINQTMRTHYYKTYKGNDALSWIFSPSVEVETPTPVVYFMVSPFEKRYSHVSMRGSFGIGFHKTSNTDFNPIFPIQFSLEYSINPYLETGIDITYNLGESFGLYSNSAVLVGITMTFGGIKFF